MRTFCQIIRLLMTGRISYRRISATGCDRAITSHPPNRYWRCEWIATASGFLSALRWGLIPSWAKDLAIGNRMINARSETVHEKPSFRSAFRRRRCLLPANGFYEWSRGPAGKQPYYFQMADQQPFCFAGLWEYWQGSEGDVVESCTILTTEANDQMRQIHHRMPVILLPERLSAMAGCDTTNPRPARGLFAGPALGRSAGPRGQHLCQQCPSRRSELHPRVCR